MRAVIFFFLLLLPFFGSSQARRALSLIEKEKRQEAYELLSRSIEKDSLASAQHFVLAYLFIEPLYEFYDIDSAYEHVIWAQEDFDKLEAKAQSRLAGNGFDLANYDSLQKHIEAIGFVRAKDLDREEDYINFMSQFPESIKIDSAIILRDRRAFEKASLENSYKSYEYFFKTYPEAIDAPEATKRYHRLLYDDKTSSGKLSAYKEFLKDFPDTRHRNEAELAIFRIMTGRNTVDAYFAFLDEYPDSYLSTQARIFAYSRGSKEDKEGILAQLDFSPARKDSLLTLAKIAHEMKLLSHNGNDYDILREDGSVILDSIAMISAQDKCKSISNLLLTIEPGESRLLNLLGQEVVSGNFDQYEPAAEGFIKLINNQGVRLIHNDGSPTTGKLHSEAHMAGGYILFRDEAKWSMESITGIPMFMARFDSVFQFHDYLVLSENGKWGIHPINDFYPLLDQENVTPSYPYDSLAIVRNDEIFIQVGRQTGLLDSNLKTIVPLGEPEIELLDSSYFLQTNDSILDSRLANVWYSDIKANETWTIGLRSSGYELYFDGNKQFEAEKAELLGNTAVIVENEERLFCYFNPDSRIALNKGDAIKPIRKMGENSVVRHYLYTDQKNKQSVIDNNGKRIKIPRFDRLIDLGEDYMIFSVKGFVYNILDNKGKVILENVDAATSLNDGYISYLSKGKFGLLNIRNSTLIKPKYDKPVKMYNEELFVISEEGLLGLIDRNDSVYLSPKYEEIRTLNDSIAVLKSNFRWSFWNSNTGQIILDNVSDYWEYNTEAGVYFKIFKGIGYGIWSPGAGMILNSTFSEIEIASQGSQLVFVTEKWVEEADLVILLYYSKEGELVRKSVLTTKQYEELQCQLAY